MSTTNHYAKTSSKRARKNRSRTDTVGGRRHYKKINKIKDNMKSDFILFKGGMDDIHNFNLKFKGVVTKLTEVSDTIAETVQEVAEGAQHQAEETERSVSILSDNIKTLNDISKEEIERKGLLEHAVINIEATFNDLLGVSNKLNGVKESFSEVNHQGQQLASKVNDIIHIVSAVEAIAEQTVAFKKKCSLRNKPPRNCTWD